MFLVFSPFKLLILSYQFPNMMNRCGHDGECLDIRIIGVSVGVDVYVDAYVDVDVGVGVEIGVDFLSMFF